MSIDAATFVSERPEFKEAYEESGSTAVITSALRDAAMFVDSAVWGDRYQGALFVKTAELLAMTPFGENARLKGAPDSSGYAVIFNQMLLALPMRVMVSGLQEYPYLDCDD